jgi:acyl-CoA thioester hydrolase
MSGGYSHWLEIPTRWHDNDVYGHVNNVDYYAFFDTAINVYLIDQGGLDIHRGKAIGLCAESHCRFLAPLSFPEVVRAGVRVGELRTRSVRYEIGLYPQDSDEPAATGWFVHVFVDRVTRHPLAIPPQVRDALALLLEATTTPSLPSSDR